MALDAIAEFYSGLAMLERLDMTKFESAANKQEVAAEVAKIKGANEHFARSSQGFTSASTSCRDFKTHFDEMDKVALLDRDIKGFDEMSASVKKISQQIDGGTVPEMEAVHATMSLINEALVFSKMRAQAHRGMPGHYPTKRVKF
jgi:ferritin